MFNFSNSRADSNLLLLYIIRIASLVKPTSISFLLFLSAFYLKRELLLEKTSPASKPTDVKIAAGKSGRARLSNCMFLLTIYLFEVCNIGTTPCYVGIVNVTMNVRKVK